MSVPIEQQQADWEERYDDTCCPYCNSPLLEDGCCPSDDCDYEPGWALAESDR